MARRIEYIDALEHQLEWHKWSLHPSYLEFWKEIKEGGRVQSDEPLVYAYPVRKGELFYVGREFCDLVERTALDLPDCYLQEDWLPAETGLILFHHELTLPAIDTQNSGMHCDFCYSGAPVYEYPAKSFTYKSVFYKKTGMAGMPPRPIQMPSTGSWAACSACSIFIENEDWQALSERTLKTFAVHHPEANNLNISPADDLQDHMALAAQFNANRIGPRKPISLDWLTVKALGFLRQEGGVVVTTYVATPWTKVGGMRAFYPLSVASWDYGTSMIMKIRAFERVAAQDRDNDLQNAPYVEGSNQPCREADGWPLDELKYFTALLLLMNQRLLVASSQPVERHQQKRALRDVNRVVKEIKVVILRRTVSSSESDGETRVDWACRWIVRGHWRQQWYPSQGVHNPIWITPYVKGPEGLPVKEPSKSLFAVVR